MAYITEPSKSLPVSISCDVLVSGGGYAGISAALAAARAGAKTVLLEREWALGGLGTLGLVTIYLPLCDGMGHQVSFGIAEELFRLSIRHGMEDWHLPKPYCWVDENGDREERKKVRFQCQYNANCFVLEVEKLLKEAGVEIRYGTLACEALTENGRITHVIAEDKSGRFAIETKAVVDCTGDADLCKLSGAPTANFGPGNILAAWHYWDTEKDGRNLKMLGFAEVPDNMKNGSEEAPLVARRYTGIDGKELSDMMQTSHACLLDYVNQREKEDPTYTVTAIAGIPQIRMTRRLAGRYTLDQDQIREHFDDSIGMIGNWRKAGPVYEIPYGTLCCEEIENLWVAGRCISVTDAMWEYTRVIPVCAVTGEAAGEAAAMLASEGSVEIGALQNRLSKNGVRLHVEEIEE